MRGDLRDFHLAGLEHGLSFYQSPAASRDLIEVARGFGLLVAAVLAWNALRARL
jgi:hypothetical protein